MKLEEIMEAKEKKPGTYAGVRFDKDDLRKLRNWAKSNKIPNRVAREKMHVTLLHSSKHLPNYEPLEKLDPPLKATPTGFDIWETKDDKRALVLLLDSPQLVERHKDLMDTHEAQYDYDEYKPHVTLSYDVGKDFDVKEISSDVKEAVPSLKIVEEYGEDLVLDWQNKG